MAERTYTISRGGEYRVDAVGTNTRRSQSNVVEVPNMNVEQFSVSAVVQYGVAGLLFEITMQNVYDDEVTATVEFEYDIPSAPVTYPLVKKDNVSLKNGVNTLFVPLSEVNSLEISPMLPTGSFIWTVAIDGDPFNGAPTFVPVGKMELYPVYDIRTDTMLLAVRRVPNASLLVSSFYDGGTVRYSGYGGAPIDKPISDGVIGKFDDVSVSFGAKAAVTFNAQISVGNFSGASRLVRRELCKAVFGLTTDDYLSLDGAVIKTSISPVTLKYLEETNTLEWDDVDGATSYEVFRNGMKIADVPRT